MMYEIKMGETLHRLTRRDEGAKEAGKKIESAINEILALEKEFISLICYKAFEQLKKARNIAEDNDYLYIIEALTDDNLIDIIDNFKIDKALINMGKGVKEELEDMVSEFNRLKKQWQTNTKTITELNEQIETLPAKEPGGWARFLADKQPGLVKRFFLRFVHKESINEAKRECTNYETRKTLEHDVCKLQSANEELKEQSNVYEKQIENEKARKQLIEHQKILLEKIEQLERNAAVLIPKTKEPKNVVQATPPRDEDDELQFTMEW